MMSSQGNRFTRLRGKFAAAGPRLLSVKNTTGLFFVIAAFSVLLVTSPLSAETFPSRYIRFIVPFAPGGTSEIIARVLAKKMGDSLGQNIVIENIAGATGAIGAGAVARAAPDGYTLLFGYSTQFVIAPLLSSKLQYDPIKSFEPVGTVAQFRMLFTANAKLPVSSMKDFADYAKKNPGKLSYGSPGIGTFSNMIVEQFKLRYGLDIVHVPYRGGGPAILDLVGGRLDFYSDAVGALIGRLKDGTIKALAVSSAERLPYLPDVPSVAELGMPELNVAPWAGLFAPAGTPKEVISILSKELNKALQDPELRKSFEDNYYEIIPGSPEDVTSQIQKETEQWRPVVQATGMKLD